MKASEDCKARIEEQLNSISSLRKSLFDEIAAHLENLESKSKQWEGFQEQLDKFVEYMDTVDSRLERSRRESRVSQEWLAQVKVRAPGGGTLGISGWGCAAGTLEPLTYTRASSAEFCYPILE